MKMSKWWRNLVIAVLLVAGAVVDAQAASQAKSFDKRQAKVPTSAAQQSGKPYYTDEKGVYHVTRQMYGILTICETQIGLDFEPESYFRIEELDGIQDIELNVALARFEELGDQRHIYGNRLKLLVKQIVKDYKQQDEQARKRRQEAERERQRRKKEAEDGIGGALAKGYERQAKDNAYQLGKDIANRFIPRRIRW